MDGAPNGLFTLGKAVVTLNDINDNPPTFRQASVRSAIILFAVSLSCIIKFSY